MERNRDPLKRFGEALEGVSASVNDAFCAENVIDMMGEGLAPELRRPVTKARSEGAMGAYHGA